MPSRDWKTTKYKKTVAISQEDYDYLVDTKSRKSIAGRLEHIIQSYRQVHPEEEKNEKQYDQPNSQDNTAQSNQT